MVKNRDSNFNFVEFKDKLETYIDNINIDHSYQSQKIYKNGFIDGIKLMIETVKN